MTTADNTQMPEKAQTFKPGPVVNIDPRDAVRLMVLEGEIMRAQAGLGPSPPPDQAMLRDLSPLGR
jgi:hypothetical protein